MLRELPWSHNLIKELVQWENSNNPDIIRSARSQQRHDLQAEFSGAFVTTAWVLTEVANSLARGPDRTLFSELYRDLADDRRVTIMPPSSDLFEKLTEALTADRHSTGFAARHGGSTRPLSARSQNEESLLDRVQEPCKLMSVEYVNRKDDTYFLQVRKTKTGKPNYYFGRKLTGIPVDELPEGYEIYENPKDGQVYLTEGQTNADSVHRTRGSGAMGSGGWP